MMLSGFHNGKSVGACLTAFYCEPACADIGVFYVGGFYLTATLWVVPLMVTRESPAGRFV